MPERRVRETLDELSRQIRDAETLGPEEREELDRLVGEIEARLDRDAGREDDGEAPPLVQRLSEAAERFEASHPRLSAAVGRLVDALAAMGI